MDLQELEAIARQEIAKHGLQGWTFGWGRTKRQLGVCKYRSKRIEIAEHHALYSPRETVLDTLLHEIAHAIAGPAARHGPAWKAVAQRLGATPKACAAVEEIVAMPGDWQATCPACQKTFHKYKRPRVLTGYRCRCPARSPLTFEYKGQLSDIPAPPATLLEAANWEAQCAGCQMLHLRLRKPKAGVWRCKCPHRCELTWQLRSSAKPAS